MTLMYSIINSEKQSSGYRLLHLQRGSPDDTKIYLIFWVTNITRIIICPRQIAVFTNISDVITPSLIIRLSFRSL